MLTEADPVTKHVGVAIQDPTLRQAHVWWGQRVVLRELQVEHDAPAFEGTLLSAELQSRVHGKLVVDGRGCAGSGSKQ